MIDPGIRSALITILKSKRRKMNPARRKRGLKPQRWLYPWTTEKHYAAALRAWFRPMRDYVRNYLKEHSEAILHGDSANLVVRQDATTGRSFRVMIDSLNAWAGQYVSDDPQRRRESPIYMGLGNIADTVFDFNEGQYEKSAKASLGIEFPVGEDWWPDAKENWARLNYELIGGDLRKYVRDINSLTERAVTSGWSLSTLTEQLKSLDGKMSEGRSRFVARDQIGKLNGEITQRRMESAGLSMYIWSTSGDERVRGDPGGFSPDAVPSHYLMDEKLCRWDDSTVYSDDGGKTWRDRPSGAVQLHPGQDYQCRCTALAYWDELVNEVDAEIAESEEMIPNFGPKPEQPIENPPKKPIINMGNLENSLGKEFVEKMQERLENSPASVQKAWNSRADKLKVADVHYKGNPYHDPRNGIYLDVEMDKKTRVSAEVDTVTRKIISVEVEPPHSTAFHEFFHNMSKAASEKAGKTRYMDYADVFQSVKHGGLTLTEMLKKEAQERINTELAGLKAEAKRQGLKATVRKYDACKIINDELKALSLYERCDISDMWEGATNGDVVAGWGHLGGDKSYWKKISVGTEAFAEMGKATVNHPESLARIKQYFPKSYDIFLEMLESIGSL